ncbi:MAG: hypothetical protein LBH96_01095 [Candidatus Peribacteria bacterium]|jgi:hypothetical protein|nr:hypothetical protein [Candidatus Peribacteria bacterium]
MIALQAKRNEERFFFYENPNKQGYFKVKDKCFLFSHTIKKLDNTHLEQRKKKWDELHNPKIFARYQGRLNLKHLTSPDQANTEEKIKILRYLIVLHTKLAPVSETVIHLLLMNIIRKKVDLNKIKSRKEAGFLTKPSCISVAALCVQLAKEVLALSGKLHSIAGHHVYAEIIANHQSYFVDFSKKLIELEYKKKADHSGVFASKAEHKQYIKDTLDGTPLY